MQNAIKIAAFNVASKACFLNSLLDREHVLYKNIRSFHQDINSSELIAKNSHFHEEYMLVEKAILNIEEQICDLGYFPEISLKGFLVLSLIQELKPDRQICELSMNSLLESTENITMLLQQNIKMFPRRWFGIEKKFIIKLIGTHKKISFMLRSQMWRRKGFFYIGSYKRREIFCARPDGLKVSE